MLLRLIIFGACLTLGGCASVSGLNSLLGGNSEKEAKESVVWNHADDAIVLEVTADKMLNLFDGITHTLALNVVQAAETNPIQALVKDPARLQVAMQTGDAPGIVSFERFVIEPGTYRTIRLDRAEKTRYIAVVAAYFEGATARNARLFRVGVDLKTEGLVVKTRTAKPSPLAIRMRLGPNALAFAEATGFDPMLPPDTPALVPIADGKPKQEKYLLDSMGLPVERTILRRGEP